MQGVHVQSTGPTSFSSLQELTDPGIASGCHFAHNLYTSCSLATGGNMVGFVTKRRETKAERGGLCLDEDETRYYFK